MPSVRFSGGVGMISSWVTDAAPCRCAVPRQSAPVSPPPMITTCLPSAVIGRRVDVALLHVVGPRQVLHRLVDALGFAAGRGQVAPRGGPAREHDRVELAAELLGRDVRADVDRRLEDRALVAHLGQAPVEPGLLHLELGDAVAQQPADAVGALEHHDVVPDAGELLGRRQPGRAGADHRDLLARCGSPRFCGGTQPSSHARSMISISTCLIVTASELIASTHAASHGAGQSVPVNSGKLLVACSRSVASRQSWR